MRAAPVVLAGVLLSLGGCALIADYGFGSFKGTGGAGGDGTGGDGTGGAGGAGTMCPTNCSGDGDCTCKDNGCYATSGQCSMTTFRCLYDAKMNGSMCDLDTGGIGFCCAAACCAEGCNSSGVCPLAMSGAGCATSSDCNSMCCCIGGTCEGNSSTSCTAGDLTCQ